MLISKRCLQGPATRVQIVFDVWVIAGMEYKRPGSLLLPNRQAWRATSATAAISVGSNGSSSNPLKYLRCVLSIHDWLSTNQSGSHTKSYAITKDHKRKRGKYQLLISKGFKRYWNIKCPISEDQVLLWYRITQKTHKTDCDAMVSSSVFFLFLLSLHEGK